MKVLVHILLDVLKLTNEACSKHSPTPFPCLWEQNSDTSSCGERYSGHDDTELGDAKNMLPKYVHNLGEM